MPLQFVQTSDVPQSTERLTDYANNYVVLVPTEEREQVRQTRFGERPFIRVQAYVYKNDEVFDLGMIPVFQGTIRNLISAAASRRAVVAGELTKVDNRWVFSHDEKNKNHVKALEAISAVLA